MRVMINRKSLLHALKRAAHVARTTPGDMPDRLFYRLVTRYAKVEVSHGRAELLSSNGHTIDVIDKLGEVRSDEDAGSLFILIDHTLKTIKGTADEFVFFEGTESSTTLRFGTFKSTYSLMDTHLFPHIDRWPTKGGVARWEAEECEAEERVIAEYTFGAEDYAAIAEM